MTDRIAQLRQWKAIAMAWLSPQAAKLMSLFLLGLIRVLTGSQARWWGCPPKAEQRIYFANHLSGQPCRRRLGDAAPLGRRPRYWRGGGSARGDAVGTDTEPEARALCWLAVRNLR